MKKSVIILILLFIVVSCSSSKLIEKPTEKINVKTHKRKTIIYDYVGFIDIEKLNFIKKNYKWNNEEVLIINYSQPVKSCHFDNHKINSVTKKFYKEFYEKIDTENCLNIKVLANGERVRRKLDNISYFDDKDDFLQTIFFERKKSCFGILVIHKNGNYLQYNGHYSERDVAQYIYDLKNNYLEKYYQKK
ncbi:hypothetical protein FDT66_04110 [Polaribacter aestuariivivens]|uniref:Lipoprotein n=1 Tax=Polaribacter aestuariivivens TaxID=2304626 RepID=A0A5S3N779_9FLAO|nr:hypothetical protein [Polaribacter aestuariivivens]TMM31160.1 hypothetical protein FDT66_04110 [Polaribacter aestuariivivens]